MDIMWDWDGGRAAYNPTADLEPGLGRARRRGRAGHRRGVAEQARITDAQLLERIGPQLVREVGVDAIVAIFERLAADGARTVVDPLAHRVNARTPRFRAHHVACFALGAGRLVHGE